jgi:hypothetical protein
VQVLYGGSWDGLTGAELAEVLQAHTRLFAYLSVGRQLLAPMWAHDISPLRMRGLMPRARIGARTSPTSDRDSPRPRFASRALALLFARAWRWGRADGSFPDILGHDGAALAADGAAGGRLGHGCDRARGAGGRMRVQGCVWGWLP